jgi:hypothetical protein
VVWPLPYESGRDQMYREIFKQKQIGRIDTISGGANE